MSRLLLKYPTRSRPQLFMEIVNKWESMLSGKHEYQWLITADSNDTSMNNDSMRYYLHGKANLIYRYGSSQTKVEAINADMDLASEFDTLVLVSDDMVPQVHGYDDIICSDMNLYSPDLTGALWYADGRVNNRLWTLYIAGREYYKSRGFIYHPDFKSVYVDNLEQDYAQSMGKLQYIDKCIIKHCWLERTGKDALYRRNEGTEMYSHDKTLYERMRNEKRYV